MAESLLKDSADYQSLRRIPGVGPITAMTVIAEAGDLRRFDLLQNTPEPPR
jgi:transposase